MTPYQKIRDTGLALVIFSGLACVPASAWAQEAAWEGMINAGQSALQQQNYTEAENLFESALEAAEDFPAGDARLGKSLNNLAAVYYAQQDYARAEPLMRRSVTVLKDALGPESADVAQTMKNLAALHYLQGNFADAEPLLKQSLAILEKVHGPNHAYVATVLSNLAGLYQSQDRYNDAEPLLSRSLEIWESLLGAEHPDVVKSRKLLSQLREAKSRTPTSDEPEVETARKTENDSSEDEGKVVPAVETVAETDIDDEPLPGPSPNAIAALIEEVKSYDAGNEQPPANGAQSDNPPVPAIRAASLDNLDGSEVDGASVESPDIDSPSIDRLGNATFAVHLSTLWSQDEAKRYWQSLQQELPEILDGKTMEIQEISADNGQGSFYRVLTSPFASDPDAQATCDRIKDKLRTHDCSVIAR